MVEPWCLSRHLAERSHAVAIHRHGGLPGIRDLPGREATLASPKNHWAYSGEENLFALAAVLMVAVAKAHPFNDANKRTSISCAVMFLGGNGISVQITDDDLVFHAVRGHAALKLVATKKWIRLPFGCNLQPHAIEEQDKTTLVCKP